MHLSKTKQIGHISGKRDFAAFKVKTVILTESKITRCCEYFFENLKKLLLIPNIRVFKLEHTMHLTHDPICVILDCVTSTTLCRYVAYYKDDKRIFKRVSSFCKLDMYSIT